MNGAVAFVGAGPGDPRLLTLRGAELLARADAVVHAGDVHPETLARANAALVRIDPSASAEAVAGTLVSLAREGKRVVRLFSGDPMLFASGDSEVASVAREGVPIEIVAGVIVPTAVAAYTGLALTSTSDTTPSVAFAVVRDAGELHDWKSLSLATDTLALLVAADQVEELTETLTFYGRAPDTPAALVRDASLPSQRVATGTLVEIRKHAPAFAPGNVLLLVGKPLAQREGLRWFDTRPLSGKRVLLTRPREQGERTAALLRERGAEPIVLPAIEIGPAADTQALDAALASLGSYAWVVFTSENGVARACGRLYASCKDARAFGGAKIAAIGPATAAALERFGLRADVTAKEHVGEALAAAILAAMGDARGRVLVLRAKEARDVMPEALRAAGCEVDVVAAYETKPAGAEALAALLEGSSLDAVTFTSASTVRSLAAALGDRAASLLAKVVVASIGPITTEAAETRGIRVDVTAREYTLPGLISALESKFLRASAKQ